MSHEQAKQLTIRGIPLQYYRELVREAQQRHLSVNQLLLDRLLPPPKRAPHGQAHALLTLAGTWDAKRARDLEQHLTESRRIDSELWK